MEYPDFSQILAKILSKSQKFEFKFINTSYHSTIWFSIVNFHTGNYIYQKNKNNSYLDNISQETPGWILNLLCYYSILQNFRLTFKLGDVLPARIRACVSKTRVAKMCRSEAWERARRATDLAERRLNCPNRAIHVCRLLYDVGFY